MPHEKTRWKEDGGEASSLGPELRGKKAYLFFGVGGGVGCAWQFGAGVRAFWVIVSVAALGSSFPVWEEMAEMSLIGGEVVVIRKP